jgi:lactaldehyde dehydrogenase / glycolaldehyde dehydrogenase
MQAALRKTKYGDPFESGNDMVPIVNKAQLEHIDDAVKGGIAAGCDLLLGGAIDESKPGYHYLPRLLANCPQQSAIMHQEIFGPVLPVATFTDLDDALDLANDCEYGLTSSIFTRDLNTAFRAANELKFGETYINLRGAERAGIRIAQLSSYGYASLICASGVCTTPIDES